jgi:rare lipoprotein A
MKKIILFLLTISNTMLYTTEVLAKRHHNKVVYHDSKGYHDVGKASWYGSESGNRNADGSKFNPHGISAAHRWLPFGTLLRVTNLSNNKSIIVPVKDRGPFIRGRILDLSQGAARMLGITGIGHVEIEAVN